MARSPSPADVAYEHVRRIALGFPGAEEKLSHGTPAFHVRGKMFLTFVDDHHGDGHLAVWCKSTLEEQRRLVASSPERFYVPPYVGVKGWVGVNIDETRADWVELAMLVEEAWASVAPPRVLRGEGLPKAKQLAPPPARATTDPKVARDALARLTKICLAMGGVEQEREGRHATFRVRKKVFAYFLDNHHGDGAITACLKGDKREHTRIVAREPQRYVLPAYIGSRGYLGVRLDCKDVDWEDIARRVAEAYERVVPAGEGPRRPTRPAGNGRRQTTGRVTLRAARPMGGHAPSADLARAPRARRLPGEGKGPRPSRRPDDAGAGRRPRAVRKRT
jgi:hypothetical protein